MAVSRDEPSAWDEADDGAGEPGGDEAGSLLAGIPVRRRRRGLGRDVFEALCMAGLLFLGIQGVMRQFVVENISMPTLDPGDRIFVDRLSWRGVADLARGDVVVFRAWDEDKLYVKRVIGLPGDTLAMRKDGDVFVNGERLDGALPRAARRRVEARHARPDEYFVMGDNRPSSADSRLHGPVKRASIVGRAWSDLLAAGRRRVAPQDAAAVRGAAEVRRAGRRRERLAAFAVRSARPRQRGRRGTAPSPATP
ncbi:MAG: signal peptidase I [Anaerolineae bacterium]